MPRTNTVIIGAGHAGLAMSWHLADKGVPHVVLDRGGIGERWRSARWDSFRLLSPNWLTRLPGKTYEGPDPDGFMTAPEVAAYLDGYASSFEAPVRPETLVTGVEHGASGFVVDTSDGAWTASNVVIATGYHNQAKVPGIARGLAPELTQVTPSGYRSPRSLPDGGVLVVGASASGVQIAHELAGAGRDVLLAVGSHTRLPRTYRGRDILWWLDRIGSLDRCLDDVPDAERAKAEPSLQLSGSLGGTRMDLGVLQDAGVRLAGRLVGLEGTTAVFRDDLADTIAAAQQRLDRLLGDVDEYAVAHHETAPQDPPPAIDAPAAPSTVDLRRAGITGVVWATGFRPWYPWLHVPVFDRCRRIRHQRGVTDVPGLYAIGLRFQSRRNSTFIDGARHDAAFLAHTIVASSAAPIGV
jgi:putative flavoprotein involved in K+ transport